MYGPPVNATQDAYSELLRALAERAREHYGPRLISLVIFGSVGRGRPRPDSDVDVLIVADGLPAGRARRARDFETLEAAMEGALQRARRSGVETYLSPVFKTREEATRGSPLFLDMVEDAQLLIDADDFFKGILDRLRRRMADLGSKRVWRGTHWYWILKPDLSPGESVEL